MGVEVTLGQVQVRPAHPHTDTLRRASPGPGLGRGDRPAAAAGCRSVPEWSPPTPASVANSSPSCLAQLFSANLSARFWREGEDDQRVPDADRGGARARRALHDGVPLRPHRPAPGPAGGRRMADRAGRPRPVPGTSARPFSGCPCPGCPCPGCPCPGCPCPAGPEGAARPARGPPRRRRRTRFLGADRGRPGHRHEAGRIAAGAGGAGHAVHRSALAEGSSPSPTSTGPAPSVPGS